MLLNLLGKRWRLRFAFMPTARGHCDPPDKPGKEIKICTSLRDRELLEVLLHEMLHATNWSLDEEFVDQASGDIAAALWKIGYRKCELE